MRTSTRTSIAVVALLGLITSGCGSYVFYRADIPQTPSGAETALADLAKNPKPLRRRLVLIHGWRDSEERWDNFVAWLQRCTTNADEMVTVVDHSGDIHIPDLTQWIMDEYEIAGEVDVVGHSMGGLIAREANRTGRIRINTLYSMASPHNGSYLARYGPWYRQLREMAPGSDFLNELNADPRSRGFRVVSYWMKGDFLLRQRSSESLGGTNIIMSSSPKPFFRQNHHHLVMDERTIYDVIRRLTYPSDLKFGAPPAPLAGTPTVRYADPIQRLSETATPPAGPVLTKEHEGRGQGRALIVNR